MARPPLNKAMVSVLTTLSITLAGIGGLTGDYYLRPAVNLGYDTVTENEYIQIRNEMITQVRVTVDAKTNLSYAQYAMWIAVCNEEASREKIVLNNVTGVNLHEKLLTLMEAR